MTCCLCASKDAPFRESRPSGRNGRLQAWRFCPSCWRELEAQRRNCDPELMRRYAFFFRFISGDPALACWRLPDKADAAAVPAAIKTTENAPCPDRPPGEIA